MSDLTSVVAGETSAADYEAVVDQLLVEMRHIEANMQKDRTEIERLKLETARLEAENQLVLNRMKVQW